MLTPSCLIEGVYARQAHRAALISKLSPIDAEVFSMLKANNRQVTIGDSSKSASSKSSTPTRGEN